MPGNTRTRCPWPRGCALLQRQPPRAEGGQDGRIQPALKTRAPCTTPGPGGSPEDPERCAAPGSAVDPIRRRALQPSSNAFPGWSVAAMVGPCPPTAADTDVT